MLVLSSHVIFLLTNRDPCRKRYSPEFGFDDFSQAGRRWRLPAKDGGHSCAATSQERPDRDAWARIGRPFVHQTAFPPEGIHHSSHADSYRAAHDRHNANAGTFPKGDVAKGRTVRRIPFRQEHEQGTTCCARRKTDEDAVFE